MSIPLQGAIIYGPIDSRRLGRSLGVNILPAGRKECNFNCAYCQYGWTPRMRSGELPWPEAESIAAALDAELRHAPHVDRVTLAGNGEPTLHPAFPRIVDELLRVRDRRAPGARLAVLSNASTLDQPAVVAALHRCDERYMKLDAGDDETVARMNGCRVPVERLIRALSRIDGVILQSMFTRHGDIDNTTPAALDSWVAAVRRIRPLAVHIYTLAREPAWHRLAPVPTTELAAIAGRVEAEAMTAVVF